jgi:hypothetical protein
MSDRILDLSNAANWSDLYEYSETAIPYVVGSARFYPMPEQEIPVSVERRILAAYASSDAAEPHWKSAGWLNQQIATGLTVGGIPEGRSTTGRRILLDRVNLIDFPLLASTYGLTFKPHYWLRDVSLRLWEYTGPDIDPLADQIDLVRIDLLRTEAKVNILLNG